jgi:hypothetical protein
MFVGGNNDISLTKYKSITVSRDKEKKETYATINPSYISISFTCLDLK